MSTNGVMPVRLALLQPLTCAAEPLGLHPVTVREIDGAGVKIGPIEAFESEPEWHYAGGPHQVSVDACRRMIGVVISASGRN